MEEVQVPFTTALDDLYTGSNSSNFDDEAKDDQERERVQQHFASIDVTKLDCAECASLSNYCTDRSTLGISETRILKRTCSMS
jgi:hypothetical protein